MDSFYFLSSIYLEKRILWQFHLHFYKVSLDDITSQCSREKLSLNVYNCCFSGIKVSMDKHVMNFANWSWHYISDVSSNALFSLISNDLLNFIIRMNNRAHMCWCCRYYNDGWACIFSKLCLFILLHIWRWLTHFAPKYTQCFFKYA